MESWEVSFARMFKERDNEPQESAATGKIITVSPLSVGLGDEIILDNEDLIISSRIYDLYLKVGDPVILIPTASGQKYYVIDKVGKANVPDS